MSKQTNTTPKTEKVVVTDVRTKKSISGIEKIMESFKASEQEIKDFKAGKAGYKTRIKFQGWV